MKYKIFWRNGDVTEVEGDTISDAINNAGIGAGALSAIDYYTRIAIDYYTPQDILRDWFEEIGPATSAEALQGQLIVSLSGENWRKLGEACGLPESEIEKLVEKNNDIHSVQYRRWGPCRGWRKLQDCPIQHPQLFAMESNPVAGIYGHGQTEWYRSYTAAKSRLESVPIKARWHGQRYGGQGDEPIRFSPVGETLWKVIFKYSPTYWLEASTNAQG